MPLFSAMRRIAHRIPLRSTSQHNELQKQLKLKRRGIQRAYRQRHPSQTPALSWKLPKGVHSASVQAKQEWEMVFPDPTSAVLGIETSCDDTCAAVVLPRSNGGGKVISEHRTTQEDIHNEHGGIVPRLAACAHEEALPKVVSAALEEAQAKGVSVGAVAVTVGPGLEMCLWRGAKYARECAQKLNVPLLRVHHMEAHALMSRMEFPEISFPFLALLVSGGHTLLTIVDGVGHHTVLGGTLDNALGEVYDKVARAMSIPWNTPGGTGKAMEELAKKGERGAFHFTVPMRKRSDCDFSFAGLMTNVLGSMNQHKPDKYADIAAAFQESAVEHVVERIRRALRWSNAFYPRIRNVVVSGGVAQNQVLRSAVEDVVQENNYERKSGSHRNVLFPSAALCGDNGVMIAWAGIEMLRAGLLHVPRQVDEQEVEWSLAQPREMGWLPAPKDLMRITDEELGIRGRWPLSDPDTAHAQVLSRQLSKIRGRKRKPLRHRKSQRRKRSNEEKAAHDKAQVGGVLRNELQDYMEW